MGRTTCCTRRSTAVRAPSITLPEPLEAATSLDSDLAYSAWAHPGRSSSASKSTSNRLPAKERRGGDQTLPPFFLKHRIPPGSPPYTSLNTQKTSPGGFRAHVYFIFIFFKFFSWSC